MKDMIISENSALLKQADQILERMMRNWKNGNSNGKKHFLRRTNYIILTPTRFLNALFLCYFYSYLFLFLFPSCKYDGRPIY